MRTTLYKSPNPRFDSALVKILFILLFIAYALLMGGCMNARKATSYLERNGRLSGVCESRYPLRIDTLTRRDTLTRTDTLAVFARTDTEKQFSRDSVTLTITRTITKTITNTITKEDVARVNAQQDSMRRLNDSLSRWREVGAMAVKVIVTYKDERDRKAKTNLHLWIALVIATLVIFRKPLFKLLTTL